MAVLWVERFALLGALSALALSLMLHNTKIQSDLLVQLNNQLSQLFGWEWKLQDKNQDSFKYHPRLTGKLLNRRTSLSQARSFNHRSVDNSRHAPKSGHPSFSTPSHLASAEIARSSQDSQPSFLLTLFTFAIVVLIIYTLMQMLTARFQKSYHELGQRNYPHSSMQSRNFKERNQKSIRLTREERVRELIMVHGGKNVSNAVKFLANELKKHKQHMIEEMINEQPCTCSCHVDNLQGGKEKKETIHQTHND